VTDAEAKALEQELERERKELQKSLDETLETTIREAWRTNALVWLAVTAGAFVLNLVMLLLVAGG
jgi:hypothetical protein